MAKKSRHTELLTKLGFTRLTAEQQAYLEDRYNRRLQQQGVSMQSLSRNERRLVKKVYETPSFTIIDGENPSTHVFDENRERWTLPHAIDPKILTDHGFVDNTPFLRMASSYPSLPPRKMDS